MQSPRVIAIVVAALFALVATSNRVSHAELHLPATEYLPLRSVLSNFPVMAKRVASIISKSPLPGEDMIGSIESKWKSCQTLEEREFFHELMELNNSQAPCRPNMRRYVMTILALAKANEAEPEVQNYVAYVRSKGYNKYGECVRENTYEYFSRECRKLDENLEAALDELFQTSLVGGSKSHIVDDQELYEAARSVNFATGTFKARQMLIAARRFAPNFNPVSAADPSSHEHLGAFIQHWCAQLQSSGLADVLADFNLARAFGAPLIGTSIDGHELLPSKFYKMNEYNRACLTWQEHSKEAMANLKSQLMAAKPKKWYKF